MYNSIKDAGLVKVLKLLQTHNTEYLSGQDLSDVLKISRVAVWKHIKKIRELGYTIESKQKFGYKLTSNSKLLLPWEITAGLQTKKIGKKIYYFDEIDSTQSRAIQMAAESENHGTLVIAARQNMGRGRLGKKWISPDGGIWCSIIFHPTFEIALSTVFPMASSLALAYAIEKLYNTTLELKWPNDVTSNGKKIAGILVDGIISANKLENLILGVGINVDIDCKIIQKQLNGTPNFYGADSIHTTRDASAVKLIQTFLVELEKIYQMLEENQTKEIISQWTKKILNYRNQS